MLRRLRCPRCGAEFRPTVPWSYVRMLLFLILLMGLATVILVIGRDSWLVLLFIAAVVGFFWYLSRLVNLEQIAGDIPIPEGPVNSKDLHLELERQTEDGEEVRGVSSLFFYLVAFTALILFTLLVLHLVR